MGSKSAHGAGAAAVALFALAAMLCTAGVAATVDDLDRFSRANELFAEGQYAAAAELYQSLIDSGCSSPAVEYNLGNARFRLGDVGLARLHWERAVLLDPSDADARANISLVERTRLHPTLREENFTTLRIVLRRALAVVPHALALALGLVSFFAANVLLLVRQIAADWLPRAVFWTAFVALATFAVVFLVISAGQSLLAGNPDYAIVTGADTQLCSEPSGDAPSKTPIPEALKVRIGRILDDWVEVFLPNGSSGWLRSEVIRKY